jgi:hypothetical protein
MNIPVDVGLVDDVQVREILPHKASITLRAGADILR